MVATDLSIQFQEICKKAKIAQQNIDASRNQLRAEVIGARAQASDAAEHHVGQQTVPDEASQPWEEIRDKCRDDIAKVAKATRRHKAERDAGEAVQNAGAAESYASEAIQSALDAIDDAEAAVLDGLQARATANALVQAISSTPRPGQVSY